MKLGKSALLVSGVVAISACGAEDATSVTTTQAKGGGNKPTSPVCAESGAANTAYRCVLSTKLNGDLSWSLESGPDGLVVQERSGVLRWTPTTAQRGNVPVVVLVQSGNRSERISFTINVSGGTTDPAGIYVSASGNDGNSGSVDAPFLTLQRAVDTVQPGQTIYVRGGEYRNAEFGQPYANRNEANLVQIRTSGTASQPITLRNFGNEFVRFRSDVNGIRFNNSTPEYWTLKGIELVGNAQELTEDVALANWWSDEAILPMQGRGIGGKMDHITIEDMIVRDFPGAGIAPRNSEYVTLRNNIVFNNAWWSTAGTHGITVSAMKQTATDTEQTVEITGNMTFANQSLIISHVFSKGKVSLVLDEGNGIHLQNNTETFGREALIENNVSFWNGKAGLGINTLNRATIRNNAFYRNARVVNRNGEMSVQSSALRDVSSNLFHPRSHQQTYKDFQNAYSGLGSNATLAGIAGDADLPASFIRLSQVFTNPDTLDFRPASGAPSTMGVDTGILDYLLGKIAEYGLQVVEPDQPFEEDTYLFEQKKRIFASWPATYSSIVLEDKATGHTWNYAQRCHYPNWPAPENCG